MELDDLRHLIAAMHFFRLPVSAREAIELAAEVCLSREEFERLERLRRQVVDSPAALLHPTDRDTGAVAFIRLVGEGLDRDVEFFAAERAQLRGCYTAPLEPLDRFFLGLKFDLELMEAFYESGAGR